MPALVWRSLTLLVSYETRTSYRACSVAEASFFRLAFFYRGRSGFPGLIGDWDSCALLAETW